MAIIRYNRNTHQWNILVPLDHENIIISECDSLAQAIRESASIGLNAKVRVIQ